MAEFQREHRYWAIKRKHLTPEQDEACRQFFAWLHNEGAPECECVCVESDWPIYEETWENVQRLVEGGPSIGQERDALAAQLDRPRVKILGDLLKAGIDPENIHASLARRDLLKQADTLTTEADRLDSFAVAAMSPEQEAYEHAADELRHTANELRRQIEEIN